jgi:hypothetical protein
MRFKGNSGAPRRARLLTLGTIAGTAVVAFAQSPVTLAAPSERALERRSAEHVRIVDYWTPARRAAAIPRDLVIDRHGKGFLKKQGGVLEPYGLQVSESNVPTPRAKPGAGDTTPPSVTGMSPAAGATVGTSATFQATVTDQSGLRSVRFTIQKQGGTSQTFMPSLGSNNIWSIGITGLTSGSWSWFVVAKDKANNTTTSSTVNFSVSGGGGGGGGDTVTNAEWTGGAVQNAAGRIYFEMPSNARRTRWAGYVCSGTVVNDAGGVTGRSVIVTASHCVYDDANKAFARNVLFIPNQAGTSGAGTDLNCANDPIGCWTPSFGVVDINWTTRTFPDNVAWDYAFYVVNDTGAHTQGLTQTSNSLDSAVTELSISFAPPAHDDSVPGAASGDFTHALGYSYSDDPNFMYCAEDMTTEGAVNWWLPSCDLSGGSSGGPWLQPMNEGTGVGTIISVNSWGYTNSPGMAGPKLSGSSASCVFSEAKLAPGPGNVPDGDDGLAVNCP